MAYTPKLPPYSGREKTIGASLPSRMPVTSVSKVTHDGRFSGNDAIRAAATDRPAIADLVSQWLRERCVLSSPCATSVHVLHRSFSRWAKFELDVGVEHLFAELLQMLGYLPDEGGMVQGLVLAPDFMAAVQYERAQSLPANSSRGLGKGETEMPIIIGTKQKLFEIPNEGEHLAVLADVVDLGEVETNYGRKDQLQLRWLVDQRGADGKPLLVRQRPHSKSLHEKSTLRKDVKRILGQEPGDPFDVESMLGMNAILEIEHYTREEKTYANIVAIRRPTNGDQTLKIPDDFKRDDGTKKSKASFAVNSPDDRAVVLADDEVP
jgi:hypothetical protein